MTPYLLDVNVLVAMHLPGNTDHAKSLRWFREKGNQAFATCIATQMGFIRVSSQLQLKGADLDLEERSIALKSLCNLSGHAFWTMNIPLLQAIEPFRRRIQGHRQVPDAYLLGLSAHHRGKLATLDRGILHLAGDEFSHAVELIS